MTFCNSKSVVASTGSATLAPKGVTTMLEVKKYLEAREHDCITSILYQEKKSQASPHF